MDCHQLLLNQKALEWGSAPYRSSYRLVESFFLMEWKRHIHHTMTEWRFIDPNCEHSTKWASLHQIERNYLYHHEFQLVFAAMS
jgi:hypothetical protein